MRVPSAQQCAAMKGSRQQEVQVEEIGTRRDGAPNAKFGIDVITGNYALYSKKDSN